MTALSSGARAVDVLALIAKQTAHHQSLAQSDAYSAQEAPKWVAASAAIAGLVEALRPLAGLDLRGDGFDKRPDSQPVYARDASVITVGDVRRAVAALR